MLLSDVYKIKQKIRREISKLFLLLLLNNDSSVVSVVVGAAISVDTRRQINFKVSSLV